MDSIAPNVTIIYPTNGSNISRNSIDLNASATDSRASTLTYYWVINGTTNTTTANSNSTFNASDGYYNLTLRVSDGVQNGSSTIFFTLDTTAPTITSLINRTIDDGTSTFYTNDNIYANATITDSTGINTVIFSFNDSDGVWHNNTVTSSTSVYSFNITSTNISNAGNKWLGWLYYANDSAGNMQIGNIVNYFVNILPTGLSLGEGSSVIGGRGGGCNIYADQYKTCYYIDENIECALGCQNGYACNELYRCVAETTITSKKLSDTESCEQKPTFINRLKDKCSINNLICEDAEYPFKNNECKVDSSVIMCKGARCMFTEIWFAKIIILALLFMIMFYKKEYMAFIIIAMFILLLNFIGNVPSGDIIRDVSIAPKLNLTQENIDSNLVLRYGQKVLPTNPVMGFWIIVGATYFILRYLFKKISSRKKVYRR